MKKLLLIIPLMTAMAVTVPQASFAKTKKSEKKALMRAANQMQQQGSIEFILVHAYLDGIIKEDEAYNFEIKKNTEVWSNGQPLSEPYAIKYSQLVNEFVQSHSKTGAFFSMRGDGVKKERMLDAKSSFRRPPVSHAAIAQTGEADREESEEQQKKLEAIVALLCEDGLLEKGMGYVLSYSPEGIYVNYAKLKGTDYDKYKPLFAGYVGHEEATNYNFAVTSTPLRSKK